MNSDRCVDFNKKSFVIFGCIPNAFPIRRFPSLCTDVDRIRHTFFERRSFRLCITLKTYLKNIHEFYRRQLLVQAGPLSAIEPANTKNQSKILQINPITHQIFYSVQNIFFIFISSTINSM